MFARASVADDKTEVTPRGYRIADAECPRNSKPTEFPRSIPPAGFTSTAALYDGAASLSEPRKQREGKKRKNNVTETTLEQSGLENDTRCRNRS